MAQPSHRWADLRHWRSPRSGTATGNRPRNDLRSWALTSRAELALRTRIGGLREDGGDLVHRIKVSCSYLDDEVISSVVGEIQPPSVDAVESDNSTQREPFVAVKQSMIPGRRGLQQAHVADGDFATSCPLGDVDQFGQRQVDH